MISGRRTLTSAGKPVRETLTIPQIISVKNYFGWLVCIGSVRFGSARFGSVKVQFGSARFNSIQFTLVQCSNSNTCYSISFVGVRLN